MGLSASRKAWPPSRILGTPLRDVHPEHNVWSDLYDIECEGLHMSRKDSSCSLCELTRYGHHPVEKSDIRACC